MAGGTVNVWASSCMKFPQAINPKFDEAYNFAKNPVETQANALNKFPPASRLG